ncbi:MAG: HD domain-containing phosphohydrolase [Planctomycetota bacterium]|nr:HD domain-containing phosphohydrolase [Planctomycetota bacterium]
MLEASISAISLFVRPNSSFSRKLTPSAGIVLVLPMTLVPHITSNQINQFPQEDIVRLQALLQFERAKRIKAESKLLLLDTAKDSGEPPPSRMAIIVGLVKLAESRDDDTGKHLARIRHYTTLIANAFTKLFPDDLTPEEVPIIGATSVLHDIGKVGIPDSILLNPNTLNNNQFEIMKRHTIIGADILLALSEQLGRDPWVDTAKPITLGHHERWNGLGYPFGLRGNGISLPARIVAVADVYDALTTNRIYKKASTHENATSIIINESGSHFDPRAVEAFCSVIDEIKVVADRCVESIALTSGSPLSCISKT